MLSMRMTIALYYTCVCIHFKIIYTHVNTICHPRRQIFTVFLLNTELLSSHSIFIVHQSHIQFGSLMPIHNTLTTRTLLCPIDNILCRRRGAVCSQRSIQRIKYKGFLIHSIYTRIVSTSIYLASSDLANDIYGNIAVWSIIH